MKDNDFKTDLKNNAHTLEDFFIIINKHYDTNSNKLGFITKNVIMNNIDKLISMSGTKLKK